MKLVIVHVGCYGMWAVKLVFFWLVRHKVYVNHLTMRNQYLTCNVMAEKLVFFGYLLSVCMILAAVIDRLVCLKYICALEHLCL